MSQKQFLIRARLIIINGDEILLSYAPKEDFYFFPGGKVEFGETLEEAAIREMKEECGGNFSFEKILYLRDYFESQTHNFEVYILGKVDEVKKVEDKDHPDHLQVWKKLGDLSKIDVRPKKLVPILLQDYQTGFKTQTQYLKV